MKKAPEGAKREFILDTKHYQLSPSPGASKDRSPQVQKLIEDRQAILRAERSGPDIAKIEILMHDQGFHIKGHSMPDTVTVIVLRNQDTETHGFSSPSFKDTNIRTEGDVKEVKTKEFRSYHVPPGKTATLYFAPASRVDPQTGIRETKQYPFKCDLHPTMKGEFLVIETRGEIGGG